MVKRFLILLTLIFVTLAGCTSTAGPFITDISYDGEGNLVITKRTIEYNDFSCSISNGDNPQTVVIKTPKRQEPIK